MNKTHKNNIGNIIFVSIAVILILAGIFFTSYKVIERRAKDACFSSLETSAKTFSTDLKSAAASDMEQISVIASMLSQMTYNNDLAELKEPIAAYDGSSGTISHLELLMPDNTLITADGNIIPAPADLNFADEVKKGVYISALTKCADSDERKFLRIAHPITNDRGTAAILYGLEDVTVFPQKFKTDIYAGAAIMYIINRDTGNFIMNTRLNTTGTIQSLDSCHMEEGYDLDSFREGIMAGNSGLAAFKFDGKGETLYAYYMPAGVNNWEVMIAMPESTIFNAAHRTDNIFLVASFLALAVLVAFFIWLLRISRTEVRYISYLLDISRRLFGAYRHHSRITDALSRVAEAASAQNAMYIGTEDGKPQGIFVFDANLEDLTASPDETMKILSWVNDKLGNEDTVISKEPTDITIDGKTLHMKNILAHRAQRSNNNSQGIIAVMNCKVQPSPHILKDIVIPFSMAFRNMLSYNTIHKMSVIDSLTQLKNRNCYESDIIILGNEQPDDLCCIYIDVNGLHSLNIKHGHEAGDVMLCTVSSCIISEFGKNYSYRIGGDEFVIFTIGEKEDTVKEKLAELLKTIEGLGYSASAGLFYAEKLTNITAVINAAERNMQDEKYRYYSSKREAHRSTENKDNREIKHMLFDSALNSVAFLTAVAPRFLGGYIVDLDKDAVETVYSPLHFEKKLEKSGGRFSLALREYVTDCIDPEYKREFSLFLSYEWIEERLTTLSELQLEYKLAGGDSVLLRVAKSPYYSESNRSTVWVFEKL